MKRDDQRLILWIAGGIVALRVAGPLLGGLDRLFQGLGISESAAAASLEAMKRDPGSFWNGQYWRNVSKRTPGGLVKILTNAAVNDLWASLNKAFGYFNDDETAAIAAFRKHIRTQTQLSYFSEWVTKNAGVDLLTWLEGSGYPNDRLSAEEIDIITQYVKKLPVT
jgi:hypothetical protein